MIFAENYLLLFNFLFNFILSFSLLSLATKIPQFRFASTVASTDLGSADHGFEKDRVKKHLGETNTKEFTYFVLGNGRFVYASAARLALIKVIKFIYQTRVTKSEYLININFL